MALPNLEEHGERVQDALNGDENSLRYYLECRRHFFPVRRVTLQDSLGNPAPLSSRALRSPQELEEGERKEPEPLVALNLGLVREKAELLKRLQARRASGAKRACCFYSV